MPLSVKQPIQLSRILSSASCDSFYLEDADECEWVYLSHSRALHSTQDKWLNRLHLLSPMTTYQRTFLRVQIRDGTRVTLRLFANDGPDAPCLRYFDLLSLQHVKLLSIPQEDALPFLTFAADGGAGEGSSVGLAESIYGQIALRLDVYEWESVTQFFSERSEKRRQKSIVGKLWSKLRRKGKQLVKEGEGGEDPEKKRAAGVLDPDSVTTSGLQRAVHPEDGNGMIGVGDDNAEDDSKTAEIEKLQRKGVATVVHMAFGSAALRDEWAHWFRSLLKLVELHRIAGGAVDRWGAPVSTDATGSKRYRTDDVTGEVILEDGGQPGEESDHEDGGGAGVSSRSRAKQWGMERELEVLFKQQAEQRTYLLRGESMRRSVREYTRQFLNRAFQSSGGGGGGDSFLPPDKGQIQVRVPGTLMFEPYKASCVMRAADVYFTPDPKRRRTSNAVGDAMQRHLLGKLFTVEPSTLQTRRLHLSAQTKIIAPLAYSCEFQVTTHDGVAWNFLTDSVDFRNDFVQWLRLVKGRGEMRKQSDKETYLFLRQTKKSAGGGGDGFSKAPGGADVAFPGGSESEEDEEGDEISVSPNVKTNVSVNKPTKDQGKEDDEEGELNGSKRDSTNGETPLLQNAMEMDLLLFAGSDYTAAQLRQIRTLREQSPTSAAAAAAGTLGEGSVSVQDLAKRYAAKLQRQREETLQKRHEQQERSVRRHQRGSSTTFLLDGGGGGGGSLENSMNRSWNGGEKGGGAPLSSAKYVDNTNNSKHHNNNNLSMEWSVRDLIELADDEGSFPNELLLGSSLRNNNNNNNRAGVVPAETTSILLNPSTAASRGGLPPSSSLDGGVGGGGETIDDLYDALDQERDAGNTTPHSDADSVHSVRRFVLFPSYKEEQLEPYLDSCCEPHLIGRSFSHHRPRSTDAASDAGSPRSGIRAEDEKGSSEASPRKLRCALKSISVQSSAATTTVSAARKAAGISGLSPRQRGPVQASPHRGTAVTMERGAGADRLSATLLAARAGGRQTSNAGLATPRQATKRANLMPGAFSKIL